MSTYLRNIKFTTTEANENILLIENIKNAIKERLGITTDIDYNRILVENGFNMYFAVICSATQVKINNETYNDLLEDIIYSTGEVYNNIKSIRIKDANISGVLTFKIV